MYNRNPIKLLLQLSILELHIRDLLFHGKPIGEKCKLIIGTVEPLCLARPQLLKITLLLNPDQTFNAFGYEAETLHSNMAEVHNSDSEDEEEEEKRTIKNYSEFYYFHRFKMLLYENNVGIICTTFSCEKIEYNCQDTGKYKLCIANVFNLL